MPVDFVVVGAGGFFGAVARYAIYCLERSMGSHSFPFGTLFINLLGCFLAGLLLACAERALPDHRQLILFASMGFVGSFTTFSTFSVELLQLIRSNFFLLALLNAGANTLFGVGAVWLGRFFALRFW